MYKASCAESRKNGVTIKLKISPSVILILGFAIVLSLGCQIASQAASVPTSVSANAVTPAREPTQALPPTLEEKPDISSAMLTLEDLPAGFEKLSMEELGMSATDFASENFQPENAFAFINSQNLQIIFDLNFLLDETLDRVSFDLGVSQPDITLPAFVEGMGTENVRDQKLLEDIEDIGEKQIGMTMIATMEDLPMQVDVLMFRRDIIGGMLISISLEEESPSISIHDLGSKMDQRIQETLQTIK